VSWIRAEALGGSPSRDVRNEAEAIGHHGHAADGRLTADGGLDQQVGYALAVVARDENLAAETTGAVAK